MPISTALEPSDFLALPLHNMPKLLFLPLQVLHGLLQLPLSGLQLPSLLLDCSQLLLFDSKQLYVEKVTILLVFQLTC